MVQELEASGYYGKKYKAENVRIHICVRNKSQTCWHKIVIPAAREAKPGQPNKTLPQNKNVKEGLGYSLVVTLGNPGFNSHYC